MEKAILRKFPEINEKHHKIPKSLGGKNTKDNIVRLTPREHFISHALLTKMVKTKKHKRAMSYAFVRMKQSNNKSEYSRIGNGKLYEKIKHSLSPQFSGKNNPFYGDDRFRGKNNPFYGKKHTPETIEKIKEANKNNSGENNPFYGKKHTPETKKLLSKKRSEPITIVLSNGCSKKIKRKKDIGKFIGCSISMGIQLCSIKRHLWNKYNIKEILYENNLNKKSETRKSL